MIRVEFPAQKSPRFFSPRPQRQRLGAQGRARLQIRASSRCRAWPGRAVNCTVAPIAQHVERERLARPAHIRQQRGTVWKGCPSTECNCVAGLQARPLRRRSRLHFVHADGPGQILRQDPVSLISISSLRRWRNMQSGSPACPPGPPSPAPSGQVQLRRRTPASRSGFSTPSKRLQYVSRLKPGFGCSDRRITHSTVVDLLQPGHLVDPPVVEEHQPESQHEIGHRPGEPDQHALPAGMRGESAGVIRNSCAVPLANSRFCSGVSPVIFT